MEQYEDNMKALDVEITDDDRKQINRVIRRGDSVAPFYESDFGPHQYR
jgi:aryl-alcohol dehydrogenase-like predicted oxidoreductase